MRGSARFSRAATIAGALLVAASLMSATPSSALTRSGSSAPAYFHTVPPGHRLPTGGQCAVWVRARPLPENKGVNKRFNRTTGQSVSKRFFSLSDTYGIDIAEGEDDVTLLAATVVIDLCCHGDKKHH